MKKILIWMQAVRVPTLSASIIPVALGGFLSIHSLHHNLLNIVLAAVAMTFFQIASNLINDVDDFKNKVDTKESLGSSRVIVDNMLTEVQVLKAAKVIFITGTAIGIYLTAESGLAIFVLGALGAASAYFYTRKPFQFKYRGYGVPLIFLMFGPLPVLGSYFLSTGVFDLKPLLLSIPIGLLTTAILHANDLRDIEHDSSAGIKSFAILLGSRKAMLFYIILLTASYASVILSIVLGVLTYWSALVLLTVPLAVILVRTLNIPSRAKLLDHKTASLQMVFGMLLLVSIIL